MTDRVVVILLQPSKLPARQSECGTEDGGGSAKMTSPKNDEALLTIRRLVKEIGHVIDKYPIGSQHLAEQEAATAKIIEDAHAIVKAALSLYGKGR